MANAWEIADLMTKGLQGPTGPEDSAFHTGVVNTWNTLSGVNTVTVNGVVLSNLKSLYSGVGISYQPNDVVVILRKQSQYFILGKVSTPGGTAPSTIQEGFFSFVTTFGTAGAWGNHPTLGAGPTSQVYIGSSRSCLVLFSANIKVRVGDTAFGPDIYDPLCLAAISFAVSGASTIAADAYLGQTALLQMENTNTGGGGKMVSTLTTVSGFMRLGPQHNLNVGLNTFTIKYKSGQTAEFQIPHLVVIPL